METAEIAIKPTWWGTSFSGSVGCDLDLSPTLIQDVDATLARRSSFPCSSPSSSLTTARSRGLALDDVCLFGASINSSSSSDVRWDIRPSSSTGLAAEVKGEIGRSFLDLELLASELLLS